MDSLMGNLQEAIFTMNPNTTRIEVLFCSTIVGLPFLLPPMILTEELFKAWKSCAQVRNYKLFEAMAIFIGQLSDLSLIAISRATATAMQITTAGTVITLLLLYMIFTKPLTEQHGIGLLLIAMGIILKMVPVDYKLTTRSATRHGESHFKEEISLGDSRKAKGAEEKLPLM
ncbi:hypothetical protein SADUNF_Sadunf03G0089200 [Salix dunnii]|uniref:Uncharacterized protein n=1 Tax=Salix dunnii TaxID=1413687 RepID=A0A835N207_9ROSI|nr:hypothetical protein SADUNF_Sadunf03G0089200 [Salix dunnii]